jgi:hypothetical protein
MYPQPPTYGQPYQRPYRPPTSIKVLGIMNIVFAGLGAFGLLFTYGMYFGGFRMFGGRNPAIEYAHASPTYMTFLEVTLLLGAVILPLFAASGIGLLKMRPWARKLAIGYALYAIVGAIVGLVVTYHFVLSPMNAGASSGVERAGATGGMIGGFMGGLLGSAYPIVLLAFMLRRNVREAFARVASPPA